MKSNDIFESKTFRKACEKTCEKIADEYPNEGNRQHVFSENFEKKMAELIKKPPKNKSVIFKNVGKRIAVVTAVVILGLTTTVFSVKAFRVPVINFFVKVYETFTSLFVENTQVEYNDNFQFTPKHPSYVPQGFEVENEYTYDVMYRIDYKSKNNLYYYFKQDRLYQNQIIDTEHSNYNDIIQHNGTKYYYYITDGNKKMVWFDTHYSYMISGNIDQDDMFRIAESIK